MEQRNLRTVVECSLRLCAAAEAQGLAVLSQTDRYGGAVLEPERWEEILEHVTQAHVHARQVDAALTRGRKRG
jgi:hypothetical protein